MFKKICILLPLMALLCGAVFAENTAPVAAKSVTILSPKMKEAIVTQVSREQYSSNLYMTFATYFADLGLDGCEAFFRNSSHEETEHAILFCNLLVDRGEKFQLKAIDAVAVMPSSPLDAFTKLMDNEIEVTRSIHNLYTLAIEEKDYATQTFLHQFLLLQVQEEKEAQDLLQLISLGADDPAFLLEFDYKLKEMMEEEG